MTVAVRLLPWFMNTHIRISVEDLQRNKRTRIARIDTNFEPQRQFHFYKRQRSCSLSCKGVFHKIIHRLVRLVFGLAVGAPRNRAPVGFWRGDRDRRACGFGSCAKEFSIAAVPDSAGPS